jgi:hypothetical protein
MEIVKALATNSAPMMFPGCHSRDSGAQAMNRHILRVISLHSLRGAGA